MFTHRVSIFENQVIPFENAATYVLPEVWLCSEPYRKINVLLYRLAWQIVKSHAAIDFDSEQTVAMYMRCDDGSKQKTSKEFSENSLDAHYSDYQIRLITTIQNQDKMVEIDYPLKVR